MLIGRAVRRMESTLEPKVDLNHPGATMTLLKAVQRLLVGVLGLAGRQRSK